MKKILITGAAGMLGQDLVETLRGGPFELCGVGLGKGDHLGIAYEEVDLTDESRVEIIWKRLKPDIVFHLAAMTNVDLCETERDQAYAANTKAVEIVAAATKKHGKTLVFISTDFVFDGKKDEEYSEEEKRAPLSYYGETKRLAEDAVAASGAAYVIFRICWLYGLRGRSFPKAILDIAEKQPVLKVVADQVGRPTYTRDLCRAFADLLIRNSSAFEQAAGHIFHLANSGTASWADFAEEVLRHSAFKDRKVERITAAEFGRPAERPRHAVLHLEKSEKMLSLRLRPWQEGVKDFMEEYRSEKERTATL